MKQNGQNRLDIPGSDSGQVQLVPDQSRLDAAFADLFRHEPDRQVLPAPPIHTLSSWVEERSSRIDLLQGHHTSLTPDSLMLRACWEKIIEQHFPAASGEESFELARQAAAADRLLTQWIPWHSHTDGAMPDSGLGTWRAEFSTRMQDRHWATSAGRMRHFARQLAGGAIPANILPETVTLSGFAELTVLEQSMLQALHESGVTVTNEQPLASVSAACHKSGFPDFDTEIAAAADWAGQKLDAGCERVGLIVNGLEGSAAAVLRVLENRFDPQGILGCQAAGESFFHAPAGAPLAGHPMISDALLLLRMSAGGLARRHAFTDISRLLLSTAWRGAPGERFARARLETELRMHGYFRCSLSMLADRATRSGERGSLRTLRDCIESVQRSQSGNQPVRQFLDWLHTWGWPGDNSHDQASRACHSRFLKLLEKPFLHEQADAESCLRLLIRYCRETSQPKVGGALSPIQVLTPEQAYGRKFDAAWVANLAMDNWPPRPVSNPFIGAAAAKLIPRASEEGMLGFTRQLTRGLLACAREMRFSWCDSRDGARVSPSPLIDNVPHLERTTGTVSSLGSRLYPEAGQIKSYGNHPWLRETAQDTAEPLSQSGYPDLKSAVSLLNLQSACPLGAFLVHRLEAKMAPAPEPFTDAAYRGTLAHRALERLYGGSRGKRHMPLNEGIPAAVRQALEDCQAGLRLPPAVRLAETRILEGMLTNWLEFERGLPATRIAELEWRKSAELEGFNIEVRVDRVDRLDDGRVVLLDYKTGVTRAPSAWMEDRLQEVQLPLYATLLKDLDEMEPAGIAIAEIGLNTARLRGLGAGHVGSVPAESGPEPGQWDDILARWRRQITGLLREFAGGDARHVVFHQAALAYTDIEGLLRTSELQRWVQERGGNVLR